MQIVTARNLPVIALVPATIALIGLSLAGVIADTPLLTALASLTLLVVGMPHGGFDLALLRRAAAPGSRHGSTLALILLYLGCAAAMYLAWRVDPTLALVAFIIMAIAHFAEDWTECGSRFIATGIAAGIVAAPALLQWERLRALFSLLTGQPQSAAVADAMLLVAPVGMAIALVGIAMLWQAGKRLSAVSAGCGLAAMLLLPPVLGFALFFCLVHSPRQFTTHAEELHLQEFRQWSPVVLPLTLGGLAVAGGIYALNGLPSPATGAFATSFMTLSVLTLPHMLVPRLVPLLTSAFAHRVPPSAI